MPAPKDILADPEWLAHRYDESRDEVRLRHVARGRHGEVPFLTDACLGAAEQTIAVPMGEVVRHASAAPLRFVFHSAFCASTLLARAFDNPGRSMGLSEPVILNDVVGVRRRGARPADVARLLDGAMRLLSRPFGAGEQVIVKPSNVVNPLAAAMLAIRPETRAVILYAPLPVFLASVARKGLWCRLWARELLEGLLTDGIVDLGMTPQDHFRQSDLQVAAVGWLAQHALFARLAREHGPDRVRTLDSETFLSRPAEGLAALAGHFGMTPSAGQFDGGAGSPAFTRHSKSGGEFSLQERADQQRAARDAHAEEIETVVQWAGAVAQSARIDLRLPHPAMP